MTDTKTFVVTDGRNVVSVAAHTPRHATMLVPADGSLDYSADWLAGERSETHWASSPEHSAWGDAAQAADDAAFDAERARRMTVTTTEAAAAPTLDIADVVAAAIRTVMADAWREAFDTAKIHAAVAEELASRVHDITDDHFRVDYDADDATIDAQEDANSKHDDEIDRQAGDVANALAEAAQAVIDGMTYSYPRAGTLSAFGRFGRGGRGVIPTGDASESAEWHAAHASHASIADDWRAECVCGWQADESHLDASDARRDAAEHDRRYQPTIRYDS